MKKFFLDALAKVDYSVIPAKAGIQHFFIILDSGSPPAFAGVARNDVFRCFYGFYSYLTCSCLFPYFSLRSLRALRLKDLSKSILLLHFGKGLVEAFQSFFHLGPG